MLSEKEIVEVLKSYFYMTVDKSEDIYNDTPNVARLYSQREIETEENFLTNKLREELNNEFVDIAKEIIEKDKEKEKLNPKVQMGMPDDLGTYEEVI